MDKLTIEQIERLYEKGYLFIIEDGHIDMFYKEIMSDSNFQEAIIVFE